MYQYSLSVFQLKSNSHSRMIDLKIIAIKFSKMLRFQKHFCLAET